MGTSLNFERICLPLLSHSRWPYLKRFPIHRSHRHSHGDPTRESSNNSLGFSPETGFQSSIFLGYLDFNFLGTIPRILTALSDTNIIQVLSYRIHDMGFQVQLSLVAKTTKSERSCRFDTFQRRTRI